jgi:hypothetical protein
MGLQRRWRFAACGVLGALALWSSGCQEGMPPTHLIPEGGDPGDHLPPDGAVLGTQVFTDSLFVYDRQRFALYFRNRSPKFPSETDARFIRRDEVLSVVNATQDQIRRPDLVAGEDGDFLREIYSKPYLFGFAGGDAQTQGFVAGETFEGTHELMPISGEGDRWVYFHEEQWSRQDQVRNQVFASTSVGGPEWLIRGVCINGDSTSFVPGRYAQDIWVSSVPSKGIFFHGWTLVAERDRFNVDGEVLDQAQRNPRFLWIEQGAFPGSSVSVREFTGVDQCVDGLWGEVEFFPVQLAAENVRVGQRFVTWTYISADSSQIRLRANGPELSNGETTERDSLRCVGYGVPPQDVEVDNPGFPVYYMSLLARYEVSVERMYDQLQWRLNPDDPNPVGRYGVAGDGVIDAVKFVIRVMVDVPDQELVLQRLELYLMRGIGLVVQMSGTSANSDERDVSRLQRATIDGRLSCEPDFSFCFTPSNCPPCLEGLAGSGNPLHPRSENKPRSPWSP